RRSHNTTHKLQQWLRSRLVDRPSVQQNVRCCEFHRSYSLSRPVQRCISNNLETLLLYWFLLTPRVLQRLALHVLTCGCTKHRPSRSLVLPALPPRPPAARTSR
ncbi:unnamed protein product, partial [Ectocarpus sp. 8 AP-2014]